MELDNVENLQFLKAKHAFLTYGRRYSSVYSHISSNVDFLMKAAQVLFYREGALVIENGCWTL